MVNGNWRFIFRRSTSGHCWEMQTHLCSHGERQITQVCTTGRIHCLKIPNRPTASLTRVLRDSADGLQGGGVSCVCCDVISDGNMQRRHPNHRIAWLLCRWSWARLGYVLSKEALRLLVENFHDLWFNIELESICTHTFQYLT